MCDIVEDKTYEIIMYDVIYIIYILMFK